MQVNTTNPLSTYPRLEYDKELSHFLYNCGVQSLQDITIEKYAEIFDVIPVPSPYSFTERGPEESYVSLNTLLDEKEQKQEFFLGIVQIELLRKQGVYKGVTLPVASKERYKLRVYALYLALPYHLKPNAEELSYQDFIMLCEKLWLTPDFLCERLENTYESVLHPS